jgi:predicted nicotinamide N-methyase
VEACELDPLAIAAIGLNAATNGVSVRATGGDLVGAACRWDLIMCGDVCYEAPMTGHVMPWLRTMRAAGAAVWIADPGRAYLPGDGLEPFGPVYDVPTTVELEDREVRRTRLYALS